MRTPQPVGTAAHGGQPHIQVVRRACLLLDLLAAAQGQLGLQQLATQSGLPVGTVHRLLQTLVRAGYVRQNATKVYSLGAQLIWVGGNASRMLGSWARPELSRLVRASGETASLAILDGHRATYVAQAPSGHNLRLLTELGRRAPLHSTAAGKALLATLSEADVTLLIAQTGLRQVTSATITSVAELQAELQTVRDRGYATEVGEDEVGVTGIAVAVRDQLAVAVSGPSKRLSVDKAPRLLPLMQEVARTLARLSVADELPPATTSQR